MWMSKFNYIDERIIEILKELKEEIKQKNSSSITQGYIDSIEYTVTLLNNLKDKLENGMLIDLPCKVGDTIYFLNNRDEVIENDEVFKILISDISKISFRTRWNTEYMDIRDIGNIAFLTREEAEKALGLKQ